MDYYDIYDDYERRYVHQSNIDEFERRSDQADSDQATSDIELFEIEGLIQNKQEAIWVLAMVLLNILALSIIYFSYQQNLIGAIISIAIMVITVFAIVGCVLYNYRQRQNEIEWA